MRDEGVRVEVDHVVDQRIGGGRVEGGQLVQIRRRPKEHAQHARPTERRAILELVEDPLAHVDVVLSTKAPRTRAQCIRGTLATGSLEERLAGITKCGAPCRHNTAFVEGAARPGRRHHGINPDSAIVFVADGGSNCALDHADRGVQQCHEIARVLGLSRRRVQQAIRAALQKLAAAGVAVDEFIALLVAEGRLEPKASDKPERNRRADRFRP